MEELEYDPQHGYLSYETLVALLRHKSEAMVPELLLSIEKSLKETCDAIDTLLREFVETHEGLQLLEMSEVRELLKAVNDHSQMNNGRDRRWIWKILSDDYFHADLRINTKEHYAEKLKIKYEFISNNRLDFLHDMEIRKQYDAIMSRYPLYSSKNGLKESDETQGKVNENGKKERFAPGKLIKAIEYAIPLCGKTLKEGETVPRKTILKITNIIAKNSPDQNVNLESVARTLRNRGYVKKKNT